MEAVGQIAQESIADKIFFGSLIVLMIIGRIFMGCELDLRVVKNTLKRPVAPIIGLCSQFFVMPLLAFMFARLLLYDQQPYIQFGLFVMGCVPGGDASNFWTYLLGANVNLSVTMTFISTIFSLFMTTMWIKLLGPYLVVTESGGVAKEIVMNIPYKGLLGSLFLLSIPIVIGIFIARYRPSLAERARKCLRPLIYFIVLFTFSFGALLYHRIFFQEITFKSLMAGFLLPFFGFYIGCLAAYMLGQPMENIVAISIETGVQNLPIALAVLKLSFPEWHADERLLQPVLVGAFTPLPIILCYILQQSFSHFVKSSTVSQMEEVKSSMQVVVQKSQPQGKNYEMLVGENANMLPDDLCISPN